MKRLLPHLTLVLILATLLASTPHAAKAATHVVTSANDAGPGTLRQALLDAVPGDIITFNTSIFPPAAPVTILVRSVPLSLTKNNLTIDASNAGVILDGSQAPADTNGLSIQSNNNVIRGLVIQNFRGDVGNGIFISAGASGNLIGGDRTVGNGPNGQGNLIVANGGSGIEIQGADNNIIRGNFIGIEGSGRFAQGNAHNGVAILKGTRGNVIGGTTSGFRNVISGNGHNGVWLSDAGTSQNSVMGNYIGTTADGQKKVGNQLSGVSLQNGANNNTIGGITGGAGNLISGNKDNGIYMSEAGTITNQVLGNIIGPNWQGGAVIGNDQHGVVITLGASNNLIGNGKLTGRNLISGNAYDGVLIDGPNTAGNKVQGNYISTNINGTAALPNRLHGVELTNGAHDNIIGGKRSLGQGNLLSGDLDHGLVIHFDAHHNIAAGNLIGPDATGTYSLGNHPRGGVDIAEGAHDNLIGGPTPDDGNIISGNQTDGIALFDNTGKGTSDNQIIGNRIGLALSGDTALPNLGTGVASLNGARRTLIKSNTIAYNKGYGVWVAPCTGSNIGNTITMNSIYSNTLGGILTECPIAPPTIKVTAVGTTDIMAGTTFPGARVEIFSDDDGQGRVYEGAALADSSGKFSLSKPGGFAGPNLTATSTNAAGETSAFSQPSHLLWTVLLYLNGDNDLSKAMSSTFDTVVKAGASPYANVLALVDGTSKSDTALYDITHGQSIKLSGTIVVTPSGERNMGDGKTLADFVTWGRAYYPAHHTLLAIVDHGGGWAPSTGEPVTNTLAYRHRWGAGGSGLSWDFSSNYDYLDSQEIRSAMAQITANGTAKLDVVFYDVCLMGMVEVAYQIKDYANYFVSSQNIGWAPDGPLGRYKQTIARIGPTTTPSAMAQLLVNSYAQSMPLNGHPYTISAIDMAALPALTSALNSLSTAISTTLKITPSKVSLLKAAYLDSQKVDYDGDFQIEPATDGFVDIYDFARHVALRFSDQPVKDAASVVMARLSAAVVAEQRKSGNPWPFPSRRWGLDNTHGLSIFLPLGEDLEFVVTQTQVLASSPVTKTIHLRDMYSCSELQFVCASSWRGLIDIYYRVSASPIPTSTHGMPIDGLSGILPVDITPPQTRITVTATAFTAGIPITITWTITDTQLDTSGNIIAGSGVVNATLWYRPLGLDWKPVPASTQANNPGKFVFTPPAQCIVGLAVLGRDKVGNMEPPDHGLNQAKVFIKPCLVRLPIVRR